MESREPGVIKPAGSAPIIELDLAPPLVEVEPLAGGGMILRSPIALGDYAKSVGELLVRSAGKYPDKTFLAEGSGDGWREISYAEMLAGARSVGQALLDHGLGPERPLMILSGNSIDHALMSLGAILAGVPVAPVSPAYSLMSSDFGKLRHVFDLVEPAMVFAAPAVAFEKAIAALDMKAVERIDQVGDLLAVTPGPGFERAAARVGPDTVAKYLFTSGSTGMPKGVINNHRMLCSNQKAISLINPYLEKSPPVLIDWLPWNHTFGGNNNFNMVMSRGGTLYIDDGKPIPGLVEKTVANLRRISPTIYYNVPAGFAQLVPFLEDDDDLNRKFFARLLFIVFAGAALPRDIWDRLEALSVRATGKRVYMGSGWGSTETAPGCTMVHYETDIATSIGLPIPGVEIKLVPSGSKLELRVRGPNIMPGYLKQPELSRRVIDDQGFYMIGDAGRLADPDDPAKGIVFDGRVGEDFKLTTGTWVHAGGLRVKALSAASPVLQDAVVTGHDRTFVGLLAWPNPAACARLCGDPSLAGDPGALIREPAVIDRVRTGLQSHNRDNPGSSRRIKRVLLMTEPPNIDANEITDKGYINQRATLERRAGLVERLYEEPAPEGVIVIDD